LAPDWFARRFFWVRLSLLAKPLVIKTLETTSAAPIRLWREMQWESIDVLAAEG